MKRIMLILVLGMFLIPGMYAQKGKPAYLMFQEDGKKTSYEKLLKAASEADIIFFGELHNNPVSHWLQFELTSDLSKNYKLTAGAEMFERDQQQVMEDYFADRISTDTFEVRMRNWPNYDTDYKPWLEFLKMKGVQVNATNVPRKYARCVFNGGFEALDTISEKAKSWMTPLPITVDFELKSYQEMLEMMGGHGGNSENFVRAQALKDATMAHFILAARKPGTIFIHLNGAFHSDLHEGIVWYIRQAQPELRVLTISTREYETLGSLKEEDINIADYIITVPETMTKTH